MHSTFDRPIRLQLLGEFQLSFRATRDAPALSFCKPKMLLAVLAMAEGRPYSRAALAEMLWPDDARNGRANLRHSLCLLRGLFAEIDDLWRTTNCTISLRQDLVAVDALALLNAAGYEPLSHAQRLALYRGPILADINVPEDSPFASWVKIWQTRIEREISECRTAVLAGLLQRGHIEEAIACAKGWAHQHPNDEGAHRHLIRLLRDCGNDEAAHLAFEHCVSILQEQNGKDPSDETCALIKGVRVSGDPCTLTAPAHCHLRPLAVMAAALSSDESATDPANAMQNLKLMRQRIQDIAHETQGQTLIGAGGSIVVVFGSSIPLERPAHAAAALACNIRALDLAAGVRIGLGIHAQMTLVQPAKRPDLGALVSEPAMRLAYLAGTQEILVSPAARDRLTDQFTITRETRGASEFLALRGPIEASPVLRMFDRSDEFDTLISIWNDLITGKGNASIVMYGEPGVGKSLLAGAVADYVRRFGAPVHIIRCEEDDISKPLQPVLRYLEALPLQDRTALLTAAPFLGQLAARNLPRQNAQPDTQTPTLAPGATALDQMLPVALRGEWCKTLARALGRGPQGLLIWEDLHRADSYTSSLALMLAKDRDCSQMVLLTTRGLPSPESGIRQMFLPPLSRKAMLELVSFHTRAQQWSSRLKAQVVDTAEGIPLYAQELIRRVALGLSIALPAVIADIVTTQLSCLPRWTRRYVQLASAAGYFEDGLFRNEMEGTLAPPFCASRAFRELRAMDLIEDSPPIQFRHHLIRQAVYETLNPNERLTAHNVIAQDLIRQRALGKPTCAKAIASHLNQARHPLAVHWWRTAIRSARATGDLDEAKELVAHAMQSLRFIADLDARQKMERSFTALLHRLQTRRSESNNVD